MASKGEGSAIATMVVCIVLVFLLAGAIVRALAGLSADQAVPDDDVRKLVGCLPAMTLPADTSVTVQPLATATQFGVLTVGKGEIGFEAETETTGRLVGSSGTSGPVPVYTVGAGSFSLTGAATLDAGTRLLLVAAGPLGLKLLPVTGASYPVVVSGTPPTPDAEGLVKLPKGTKGVVKTDAEAPVFKTGVTVAARAYLSHARPDAFPTMKFGETGPGRLPIAFDQPTNVTDLRACAIFTGGANEVTLVSLQETSTSGELLLPEAVFPDHWWPAWSTVRYIVVDGQRAVVSVGSALVVWRAAAAIVALLVTFVLIWGLICLRYRRGFAGAESGMKPSNWSLFFAGLFISEDDGEPSLSLFQVFFWTAITVWALLYTFIVSGSLIGLTPEMMGLLGIAGAGTVAARWIAASRGDYNVPPIGQGVDATKKVAFWDILSTKGRFDLLKLQLLVFTILIGLYVIGVIAQSGAFPTLGADLLLLMGVSQGLYIGGKVAGSSDLDTAQKIRADYAEKVAALKKAKDDEAAEIDPVKKAALKNEVTKLTKDVDALKVKFDEAVGKIKVAPVT